MRCALQALPPMPDVDAPWPVAASSGEGAAARPFAAATPTPELRARAVVCVVVCVVCVQSICIQQMAASLSHALPCPSALPSTHQGRNRGQHAAWAIIKLPQQCTRPLLSMHSCTAQRLSQPSSRCVRRVVTTTPATGYSQTRGQGFAVARGTRILVRQVIARLHAAVRAVPK
ncbi:hypothetical protein EJ04DRAFT_171561 [Polyplosphaeria fusca]|uniref:Uncharacterized protein n=1 Tax=Polyplosphaeria fusca TaxID=682080 RepID=A0A9P4R0J7_9PLEO|nr:hypothetical protein EJ04DRAFT_171561 [Polyplosphaeria fusca]